MVVAGNRSVSTTYSKDDPDQLETLTCHALSVSRRSPSLSSSRGNRDKAIDSSIRDSVRRLRAEQCDRLQLPLLRGPVFRIRRTGGTFEAVARGSVPIDRPTVWG